MTRSRVLMAGLVLLLTAGAPSGAGHAEDRGGQGRGPGDHQNR